MKKFTTLFSIVCLFAVAAFAQKAALPQPGFKNIATGSPLAAKALTLDAYKAAKAPAKAPAEGYELVTLPDGLTPTQWWVQSGTMTVGQSSSTAYKDIYVAFDGNDVYIQGLNYYVPSAWIKGTLANGVVSFPITYAGAYSNIDFYLCGYGTGSAPAAFSFNYDAAAGTLTANDYILGNKSATELGFYFYYSNLVLSSQQPEADEVVTPPDGLETEEWAFSCKRLSFDNNNPVYADYSASLKIGFAGDDVYIAGFNPYLPDAWVKGKLENNTLTIDNDQYFGKYRNQYDMYFVCYTNSVYDESDGKFHGDGFGAATFAFNEGQNELTSSDMIIIGAQKSSISYYYLFTAPLKITKVIEKAAIPAAPTDLRVQDSDYGPIFFYNIPLQDVDGAPLVGDKLYFQILSDINREVAPYVLEAGTFAKLTENMSEVPYSFTDSYDIYAGQMYLNTDISGWNKIGIKSIYYGGNERNESEIAWLDLMPYAPASITLNASNDDEIALKAGDTFQLAVASVEPEDANTEVIWSSSDEAIAKVDATGLVTAQEFDGKEIKPAQAPSDGDGYDYFPVVITATSTSVSDTTAPASASVTMWVKSSTRTAITEVNAAGKQVESIYNVNGQRVNAAGKGVYILRHSDGTVTKVLR